MADKMEGVISGSAVVDPSKYPVPIETYVFPPLQELDR